MTKTLLIALLSLTNIVLVVTRPHVAVDPRVAAFQTLIDAQQRELNSLYALGAEKDKYIGVLGEYVVKLGGKLP